MTTQPTLCRPKAVAVLVLAVMAVLVLRATAHARTPMGLLRSQSRNVQRAIQKNIEIIIRPRLVVARGATGPVTTLAISPDEGLMITAAGDRTLRVWDLRSGQESVGLRGHDHPVTLVAFSPDGRLAASTDTSGALIVWDLSTLEARLRTPWPGGPALGMGFTADGTRLAAAGKRGGISVLDLATGSMAPTTEDRKEPIDVIRHAPGRFLAATGKNGVVRMLQDTTGNVLGQFQPAGQRLTALAATSDGSLVVGGGEKGRILVWNAHTGRLLHSTDDHDGPVLSVAVNGPAGLVATGNRDGLARLWSLDGLEALHRFEGHNKAVTSLLLNKEGTFLLTSSMDGSAKLWSTLSGRHLLSLISTENGWAAVDAKGRFDGNNPALSGIEWQDKAVKLPIDNFTTAYFEPAILARTMEAPQTLADVPSIPEGIHLPPEVSVRQLAKDGVEQRGVAVMEATAVDNGQGGVKDLRLYVNGKLVADKNVLDVIREAKDGKPVLVKRFRVPLTGGANDIALVATNDEDLESLPATMTVQGGPDATPPSVHVLTVGIDHYRNHRLDLGYAVLDATAIHEFLSRDKSIPFAERVTDALRDDQATKTLIFRSLRRLWEIPAGDVAIIYMAGHGVNLDDQWYFIPHELEHPNQPIELSRKGLSATELQRELEAIGANRIFLVIDACRSGAAVGPMSWFVGIKALRMLARTVGVHILAATDRNQDALEVKSLGHGVFTYALLKAMGGDADGHPGDGVVTVQEIMRYVETVVPVLSKRHAGCCQHPSAHSRGADFTLCRP